MDRRTFLKQTLVLAGLTTAWTLGGSLSGCQTQIPPHRCKVRPWTGDNFVPMHRIRDKQVAKVLPVPTREVKTVIVGGGLTGLTAAYHLKNEPYLLLEREERLGGNAKSGLYEGVPYGEGSAYIVDTQGRIGAFYKDLGLDLTPMKHPDNLYQEGTNWTDAESSHFAQDYARLKAHLSTLLKHPDFPTIPLDQTSEASLKLDDITFSAYLKPLNLSSEYLSMIEQYCYSALGGSLDEVSAFAGINFYSEICGETVAFSGGNGAITQAIVEKLNFNSDNPRVQTGVSVFALQYKGPQEVWVSYFENEQPERVHTIRCQKVILATPWLIARRLLPELFSTLPNPQYGSYLVGNVCLKQRPNDLPHTYDHWLKATPANGKYGLNLSDVVQADAAFWARGLGQKDHGPMVLTVYAPFKNASKGRLQLFQGNVQAMAEALAQELQKRFNLPQEDIQEIRLTRYGHQLFISTPGTIRALKSFQPVWKDVVRWAHSERQGLPCVENAVTEGMAASTWV
jgi:hypothetical protein